MSEDNDSAIRRREFFKYPLKVLGSLMMWGFCWEISKLLLSNIEHNKEKGFTVIQKIPKRECDCLEDVLAPSGNKPIIEDGTQIVRPRPSDFPEISYMFSRYIFGLINLYEGDSSNIIIVNKEGFFLSPAHGIFKGILLADPGNSFYYDPLQNTIFSGEILAYSGILNLALGKLDKGIPNHPTTHLARETISNGEGLYVLAYDNNAKIQDFFRTAFSLYLANRGSSVQLPERYAMNLKLFDPCLIEAVAFTKYQYLNKRTGGYEERRIQEIEQLKNFECGLFSELRDNQLGSPVFNYASDLAGLTIASIGTDFPAFHFDDRPVPVSLVVGANSIRGFIKEYMDKNYKK
ncbi:hypothetical protein KY366_03970 [Candidatus Woesearchaeota archaeon]|nr:hypothetical protein [Candidatus Woesearchaeota archaeon]